MHHERFNTALARQACILSLHKSAQSLSERYERARRNHGRTVRLMHRLQAVRARLLYLEGGGDPFRKGAR